MFLKLSCLRVVLIKMEVHTNVDATHIVFPRENRVPLYHVSMNC